MNLIKNIREREREKRERERERERESLNKRVNTEAAAH